MKQESSRVRRCPLVDVELGQWIDDMQRRSSAARILEEIPSVEPEVRPNLDDHLGLEPIERGFDDCIPESVHSDSRAQPNLDDQRGRVRIL